MGNRRHETEQESLVHPSADLNLLEGQGDVGRREYVKLGMTAAIGTTVIGSTHTVAGNSSEATRLTFTNIGEQASYDLTVTEVLNDDSSTSYNASSNISGRNAEGTVATDVHGFRFVGDISDLQTEGSLLVTVDAMESHSEYFGPPRSIRLLSSRSATNYDITVTGTIYSEEEDFVTSPLISGRNVEGTIIDDVHAYRYTGSLSNVSVDGNITVLVNQS